MRRSIASLAFASVVAVTLAACGNSNQQPQQQAQVAPPAQVIEQPAPQVVYAQPAQPVVVQQDHSAADLATGMMLGHMMAGGGGTTVVHHYHAAPAPVIHQTTVINRTYVRPSTSYSPSYRSSVSTTSVSSYRRR
jgi:hypothetical protein